MKPTPSRLPSVASAKEGYPLLATSFFFSIAAFAWWRFSDNTADNDLWGHVLYGQRMLALGHVEKSDPFSWTAAGAPWINHEVLAELTMGWVHRHADGAGLWLLALAMAALTLFFALREARRDDPSRSAALTATALLAASTNSIALGFSVRPQLFTMLALVLWLGQMRSLERGRRRPWLTLPLLALFWINTHGGVLAGLLLLAVAAIVNIAENFLPRNFARVFLAAPAPDAGKKFAAVFALCLIASLATPWGAESLQWLIASVRYARPEITEWRGTPFDFAHASFWIVAAASVAAWFASRRPRRSWEAAVLVVLLVMAWRHQRHIPLFCLANLALTPPHLHDALRRLRPRVATLCAAFENAAVRAVAAVTLVALGGTALAASVASPRVRPWTIEVERGLFPCAALQFLRTHPVDGNLLVFFDWGQQAMWELPRNRVSFDGRFDTVYSPALITAHWRFYCGEPVDPAVLDLARADVALLPSGGAGAATLRAAGWTPVYVDPLACVLVRARALPPSLRGLALPVRAGAEATQGREPFPRAPSALARGGTGLPTRANSVRDERLRNGSTRTRPNTVGRSVLRLAAVGHR